MMINKSRLFLVFFVLTMNAFAQGGNLSSSPYSLFGLGVANNLNPGRTNALGNTGIAMKDPFHINALNPAALATISKNQFIYDLGIKFQYGFLNEGNGNERRINSNFSNISLGVKATGSSAFGLSLRPKTDVGYIITNIERSIEGSNETFTSNIFGGGGINALSLTYANSSINKFRWGITIEFLFGEINETETNFVTNSVLQIEDKNSYRGIQFDMGFQYDLSEKTSIGLVYTTPATLTGSRERIVSQFGVPPFSDDQDLDSFELPMELGMGFSSFLKDNLHFNVDYKRSLWDATDQKDQVGQFTDQNIFGFGMQYTPRLNALKYWQAVQYRIGFSLDTGYLEVNNQKINGYQFTAGLGLPLSRRSSSMLNLSYGFQSNGSIQDGLIRENYHTFTINFSFSNRWFKKRTVD